MYSKKEFIESTKADIRSLFVEAMKKKSEWFFYCYSPNIDYGDFHKMYADYKKKVGTRFFGLLPKYLKLSIVNTLDHIRERDVVLFYINGKVVPIDFFDETFNEKFIHSFFLELNNDSILKRDFEIAKRIKETIE